MTVYISLLRGINVGGSKTISMDAMCQLYAGLGFSHVCTYLQSGNVVFTSPQDDQAVLAGQIEARITQLLGFHVDVFLRLPQDFQVIIANHPFLSLAQGDNGKLHVSFLYREPSQAAWSKLIPPAGIPDKMARGHLAIYLYYPNYTAKSKIPTSFLEKALGVPITNRNWNTVNALYKLATEA